MIRVTQLADVLPTLAVAKVEREAAIVKVTFDLAGVLSVKSYVPDHVIYESVSFDWRNKRKCSANV